MKAPGSRLNFSSQKVSMQDAILLSGVKTHNLKNVDLLLPHRQFYVVTGVSGSGKSSLAFDTLYAEGQRRYVESISAYARQFLERMERPDIQSASGIPPAIAIQAKNVITNARSTVGTQTEINDYLRVLFSRVGRTVCIDCQKEAFETHPETIVQFLFEHYPQKKAAILFPVNLGDRGRKYLKDCASELEKQGFTEFEHGGKIISQETLLKEKTSPETLRVCLDRLPLQKDLRKRLFDSLESAFRYGKGAIEILIEVEGPGPSETLKFSEGLACFSCGKKFKEPVPNLFSFNSPLGACPACQGFGRIITLDWDLVIPDENKTIAQGAIEPWTKPSAAWESERLLKFCRKKKIPMDKPWRELSQQHRNWILKGVPGESSDDYWSVQDFFDYLEKKTYKMHVRVFLSKYRKFVPCSSCGESRLKPEALYVKVAGKTIQEFQAMSLKDLAEFLSGITFLAAEREKVEPVYLELERRLRFLNEVGLGYLSLDRLSRTLSGGEVQRIHLASSLGSALVDTLYVLDEPSIGLHERDNQLLIRLLKELRDLGNTVVVVEHDRAMIEAADQVLDLGPLGGERGGRIIFQGKVSELLRTPESLTGGYLSGKFEIQRKTPSAPSFKANDILRLEGASEHNLKNIDVEIPLKQFVVITGVSGSGKSTLLYDVLYNQYQRFRGCAVQDVGKLRKARGFERIGDMVLIDQSPIGRTPRSNPMTYLHAFDEIRKIFANSPQSKREGFDAHHFSFNVDGGRCPVCKGDGRVKIEMHFLADVFVPCEECRGRRFKKEILNIQFQGKNIDEVLALTVEEGIDFFRDSKKLMEKLGILKQVGLGYLRLGQSSTTLSAGEAQRMKLAYEMSEKKGEHILYLFDEPTTGLHYHDIRFLMEAMDELLAWGHSIVMIEHNMEVIRLADYVIDLGPEGGREGGELLYSGPIKGLMEKKASHTGRCLKDYLRRSRQTA